jgi:CheY-like chemotaxis protein
MISEQEFVDELRANLLDDDLVKATLVARHLKGQSPQLQKRILRMLADWHAPISVSVLGAILDLPIGSLSVSRSDIATLVIDKVIADHASMVTLSEDALIQVVTVMGESGDERCLKPLRRLLISDGNSANLRFTVYEAVSKLPMRSGAYILAAGLEDHEASVRVAAARAIDENFTASLCDGVRNMLGNPPPTPAYIASAASQAGALRLIEALLTDERFLRPFADYLEAHPDVEFMRQIQPMLGRTGRKALERLVVAFIDQADSAEGPLIYAVDDSKTVLRMYRAALNNVACRLKVFENPFEAIEWAEKEPPDLLFTDLNMPEIDGVELASTLRCNGALPDFPIVMVSTQSFGEDLERAFHSGVDSYIQKPFRAAALVDAINELTDFRLDA